MAGSLTPGAAAPNEINNPLAQVQRVALAHDPPPIMVNHSSRLMGILRFLFQVRCSRNHNACSGLRAYGGPASGAGWRSAPPRQSSGSKPNILMIMADDIGWFNVSAYNHGIMGYRTPNIDRIAKEGAMFTDWYGERSEEHTS